MSKKITAELQRTGKVSAIGKTDFRYWMQPNKMRKRSAHFEMATMCLKQRLTFPLGTSNKANAARMAADICTSLKAVGIDKTLERYKPKPEEKPKVQFPT